MLFLWKLKNLWGKGRPSFASLKSTRTTIEEGTPEGWGEVIDVKMKRDIFGLGYKPTTNEGTSTSTKGRLKSIQEVFVSVGYQVNAIDEDSEEEDMNNLMFQCEAALGNWEAIEIPQMFPLSK